jgi:dephospho-CoA kinase
MALKRIALCGRSGVGKSEVSAFLHEKLGFQTCNTGKVCRDVTSIVFGDESKAHMQQVTDALRTIDASIFLKSALRGINLDGPIVIDSVRFNSDLAVIDGKGFYLMRVQAPQLMRLERLRQRGQIYAGADDFHVSEAESESFIVDGTVMNTGSLTDLHRQILSLVGGGQPR